jgi:hypothetical protein
MTILRVMLATSLSLLLVGCSQKTYVPVKGKVTYNGAPLANVQVLFQPIATDGVDAGGVGSFAMTNEQGEFTLEASTQVPTPGALVGKHRVRIAVPPKMLGATEDTDSDAASPGGNAKGQPKAQKQPIPAKYNSDSTLSFDVPSGGTNQADFALEGPSLPKKGK